MIKVDETDPVGGKLEKSALAGENTRGALANNGGVLDFLHYAP